MKLGMIILHVFSVTVYSVREYERQGGKIRRGLLRNVHQRCYLEHILLKVHWPAHLIPGVQVNALLFTVPPPAGQVRVPLPTPVYPMLHVSLQVPTKLLAHAVELTFSCKPLRLHPLGATAVKQQDNCECAIT